MLRRAERPHDHDQPKHSVLGRGRGSLPAKRCLEIHGLMAIPPFTPVPEKARPYFQKLRTLKQQAETLLGAPLPHLSMGMSGDFEVAIEEGATIIRIGTALFGERSYARPTSG